MAFCRQPVSAKHRGLMVIGRSRDADVTGLSEEPLDDPVRDCFAWNRDAVGARGTGSRRALLAVSDRRLPDGFLRNPGSVRRCQSGGDRRGANDPGFPPYSTWPHWRDDHVVILIETIFR